MKYRLVNKIIKDNYAQELLNERGIQNIQLFLNPTKECLLNPRLLDNIEEGAMVLLENLKNNGNIVIIIDCDVDGYTSSAILWSYIKKIYPNANLSYKIHSGKQHGLEDMIESIELENHNTNLIILPDAGSNDYEYHARIKNIGIPILILDHHEAIETSENAIVVNNQLSSNYSNKQLTGAGVVWQFCRLLDEILNVNYADDYIDLAALGIISDMASVTQLENRYIIKNGLNVINNLLFQTLITKQSFSLGSVLTPVGVSWYITPLINALIRVGTMGEKEKLFQAFIDGSQIVDSTKRGEKGQKEMLVTQIARDCTNARNRQNKIKEEVVINLENKIMKKDLLNNKILFLRLEDDDVFPAVLNGLVAMQLAAKHKKPTIVARLNSEGYIRGSIRGLNESELKDFKGFLNESGLFEYCEGHANAAGCSIDNSKLESFHKYANEKLKEVNFNENSYDVNFICSANDDLFELIFDLEALKTTYGQQNEEPLIVVEDIPINKNKISIIGKNHDTVKITYNGIIYIFFKAQDFITQLDQQDENFKLTILGKANVNEYGGSMDPQIMVEKWEFKKFNLFEF